MRAHDLPLRARNEYVGKVVDNAIGPLEEVDLEVGEVEWGKFMHL